jgi:hypothetical protein
VDDAFRIVRLSGEDAHLAAGIAEGRSNLVDSEVLRPEVLRQDQDFHGANNVLPRQLIVAVKLEKREPGPSSQLREG